MFTAIVALIYASIFTAPCLQHPWSNITDTFLNLEGAASGGRPLVFRSSSLPPLRSFLPKHVPHPHLNVLSADAFARGAIRSDTDYSIYTGLHARPAPICPRNSSSCSSAPAPKPMQGLDYAFYKRRSLYHTKFDAVPYTEGGRRALWSMIEGAAGAGRALLDVPFSTSAFSAEDTNKGAGAVYFDLFAATLVLFPIHVLRTFNIVFLILAPILAILLPLSLKRIRRTPLPPQSPTPEHPGPELTHRLRRIWSRLKTTNWSPPWSRFWGALVLTITTQAALVIGYTNLNPYIIHSAPALVLTTSFALAYLTLTLPLTLPYPKPATTPHRLQILTHLRTLSYLLLLLSTLLLPPDLGGTYPISALAGCVFLAWLVGWAECLVREVVARCRSARDAEGEEGEGAREREEQGEEEEQVGGVGFDADEDESPWRSASDEGGHHNRNGEDAEPTETTPLLVPRRDENNRNGGDGVWSKGRGAQGQVEDTPYTLIWCIVELLLVLPLPLILLSHILIMLIDGMGQSVIDGGPVWIAYALPFTLTTLLLLPLAPFTHKLHRGVSYLLLISFVLGLSYTLAWAFPFSAQAPLKVYFQQSVEVVGSGVKATTRLTGVPYYLERLVVPALPSAAAGSGVKCGERIDREGLRTCVWESGGEMLPEPGSWSDPSAEAGSSSSWDAKKNRTGTGTGTGTAGMSIAIPRNSWIAGSVTRTSRSSLRVVLQGRNTRNCRIYVDSQRAAGYAVRAGAGGMQGGYEVGEAGVGEVRLWSRTWGRAWVVDVDLFEGKGVVKGRVGCEWAEYESASVGVGDGRIPALEEVLGFLPRWAVVTKAADGLVEVWSPFEV